MIAACVALALAYTVSDRAERAVEVLERALAAVGDRKGTLALTERLGTIEPEALRDARLDLTFEASIALVGMLNERTAPAALRRAEELRARLNELADPPVYLLVMLAYYAARTNRAAEAQELAERALACEPYPPPLDICIVLIVDADDRRVLRRAAAAVRGPARGRAPPRRDAGDDRDSRVSGVGVVRPWRVGRRGGGRALGAGARGGGAPDARGQRADPGADRARRARGGRGRAGATCRSARVALGRGGSLSARARPTAWRAGPPAGGARRLPGVRAAMRARSGASC